ncbi:hypothetical protein SEA_VORVOLAKOS_88 [Streptomyces phage Vorvolakos]|uniref:Uncharacterized protein n=3 Tax=Flowerpowervirus flowerpower TaxID=2846396 RepID=A0A2U8UNI5_9CAUD|nr:hypothetical protein HWB61_gp14 [Streptomyces phage FlowerPower]QEA11289.1 hypothetical protein SEA_GEOSTIN_82 [Streptomyces phage Geostin]QFP94787.1 hypothetical protein SEA_FABIAN_86 [Streptomyces phage Fabian]QZD97133.1 hypothetical protein SEA_RETRIEVERFEVER_87 [Streptomyces phage RetrieverFever]UOW93298.1 hypothetical protein SEA_VORVOLAKOS_88 [Streptomyces phage Vorvolakos]AWN05168.1 hypothetical protein SEA_FLOWERPOWER_87 [Streptomyces phage FlowerPower]
MYSGIAYAVTCHDGRGNAVKAEEPMLDDLDQVYLPLSDFIDWTELDAVMDDCLDRMYDAHYVQDAEEPGLTWEIRAYPLLKVIV